MEHSPTFTATITQFQLNLPNTQHMGTYSTFRLILEETPNWLKFLGCVETTNQCSSWYVSKDFNLMACFGNVCVDFGVIWVKKPEDRPAHMSFCGNSSFVLGARVFDPYPDYSSWHDPTMGPTTETWSISPDWKNASWVWSYLDGNGKKQVLNRTPNCKFPISTWDCLRVVVFIP